VKPKDDAWQRDIPSRFRVQLVMKEMHASILEAMKDSENRIFDFWLTFIFLIPTFL